MDEYKERICDMIHTITSPTLLIMLYDLIKAMKEEWEISPS